ncbi:MAG: PepSY domain-containing protein [Ignavibacteriales bacterium]|nr:MAG: PepSY domain-containing protein [Ignavibacteriaceae bacterium]MBW7871827.1 PepSY domain-containing protein [Ignavibacteria bacterium]MCZ2144323.1 PepSY domain-containing protein [Ignavibacteriales bacterium]MBV6446276.1 hypothetical protein [Ignavibacteriaceae bacterium]MBZ0195784.1 PepSY domain-containing protein [Ignavibacteriaceae bacterium]
MKNLVFTLFLALFPLGVFSQSLDEVLAKHFEAINQEKITTQNSLTIKGKLYQAGQQFPFKMCQERPLKFRLDIIFQGLSIIQAFDGKQGWSVNPLAGDDTPQPASEDQVASLKVQADIDGALWNWKEKGYSAELLPNEKIEDIDCYTVFLKSEEGNEFKIYIDTESFLTIMQTSTGSTPQGPMTINLYPSDFRAVDGMKYAFSIDAKVDGNVIYSMKYDSIEFNTKFDDDYFEMPE